MKTLREALVWLNDPLNWTNPGGILDRLGEHLWLSGLAVALGLLVAWPVGMWLGHTRRAGRLVVTLSNVSLAVPTLALLTLLPLTWLGFGTPAIVVALAVFAVPPLLATAYTGLLGVEPAILDAARGMGLSGRQLLGRVELPLAVPYLASGLRTTAVQVVATTTLAALVGGGGLGALINEGFGEQRMAKVLAGGVLVVVLSLLVEAVLAGVQRLVGARTAQGR